ncbi:hypothetical protein J2S52_005492 [Streptomyces sp. DSM 41037]|nr:hypothetical protein [Streptomyces sp. DSM 41037]
MTSPAAPGAQPVVDSVDAVAYTVPTDTPEGDGTLTWQSTTLVLVHVRSGATTGLGWTYGAAATAQVVEQQLAPVVTGRAAWSARPRRVCPSVRGRAATTTTGMYGYAISATRVRPWPPPGPTPFSTTR